MTGRAQLIETETEILGDGPPITVPAFAGGRGPVRHFFGTRPPRSQVDDIGTGNGTASSHGNELASIRSEAPALRSGRMLTVVSVKQVHGTDVLVLDRPVAAGEVFPGGWDAIVTDQPGLLLTVRTADCVPLLLYDPQQRVVAAVHAGWRGAVGGIVPKAIETMRDRFGSRSTTLEVGIGPSVGPCCYEVDTPVLTQLREQFSEWRDVIEPNSPDSAMLDLRALVRRQAEHQGVQPGRIRAVRVCTMCHPGLFYSYRREGQVSGTMVSGIMLLGGGHPRERHSAS